MGLGAATGSLLLVAFMSLSGCFLGSAPCRVTELDWPEPNAARIVSDAGTRPYWGDPAVVSPEDRESPPMSALDGVTWRSGDAQFRVDIRSPYNATVSVSTLSTSQWDGAEAQIDGWLQHLVAADEVRSVHQELVAAHVRINGSEYRDAYDFAQVAVHVPLDSARTYAEVRDVPGWSFHWMWAKRQIGVAPGSGYISFLPPAKAYYHPDYEHLTTDVAEIHRIIRATYTVHGYPEPDFKGQQVHCLRFPEG